MAAKHTKITVTALMRCVFVGSAKNKSQGTLGGEEKV